MRWPNSNGKWGGWHLCFELQRSENKEVLVRYDCSQLVSSLVRLRLADADHLWCLISNSGRANRVTWYAGEN